MSNTDAIKEIRGIVDDGTREIPLVNQFGKLICNIYIRPGDLSILDRYQQLTDDFASMVEPLKNINVKNDGTVTFEEEWAVMKSVEAELKRRINVVFDMDEADDIFAKRNPFSSVNGKFFCENVIEAIGGLIADTVEAEVKLSKQRVDKYLSDIQPTSPEVSGDDREATADA